MIGFGDAGGDDPHHAEMPVRIAQHDGGRRGAAVLLRNAFVYRQFDLVLQRAALLIHVVEQSRQALGLGAIMRHQEFQALRRRSQPPTGVEPRRQLKAHLADARYFALTPAHLAQRLQPRFERLRQFLQAVVHDNPVLAANGGHVRDGPQRH